MIRFLADVNIEKPIVDFLQKNGYEVIWISDQVLADQGDKMTEDKLLKRISLDTKVMLGKPVIKGTRLTVEIIIEKIAYGADFEKLKQDYPFLSDEDIRAALLYAAKRLANEEVYAA